MCVCVCVVCVSECMSVCVCECVCVCERERVLRVVQFWGGVLSGVSVSLWRQACSLSLHMLRASLNSFSASKHVKAPHKNRHFWY